MTTDEKLDYILANMATKDDIAKLEKQANDTFSELMKVEGTVLKLQDDMSSLNDKHNTLLLKSDNTAILLKLIDQQSDELTLLKARIEAVEQKLA